MNEGVPFFSQFGEGDLARGPGGALPGRRLALLRPSAKDELLWESGGGESFPLAHGEIEGGCRFFLAFSVPSAEPGPHRRVVRSYDPDSAYAITSAYPLEVTAEPAPERRSGWAT
jgi:hypothetical protein